MTPLKEQTVYIPIQEHNKNTAPIIPAQFMRRGNQFETVFLEEYPNHYFLSKEQLIELLCKVFDGGIDRGIFDIGFYKKGGIPLTKEQFINNILQ